MLTWFSVPPWLIGLEAVFLACAVPVFVIARRSSAPARVWAKFVGYWLITHGVLVLLGLGGIGQRVAVGALGFAAWFEMSRAVLRSRSTEPLAVPVGRPPAATILLWPLLAPIYLLDSSPRVAALILLGLVLSMLPPVFLANRDGLNSSLAAWVTCFWVSVLPVGILYLGRNGLSAIYVYLVLIPTDAFGEMGGRLFGSTPWMRAVSPQKTREGALAALLGGTVAGALFAPAFGLEIWSGSAAGFCISVAGQVGDLVFSAIKRNVGIKDFGKALPGQGGVLDRLDSFVFSAALIALALTLHSSVLISLD